MGHLEAPLEDGRVDARAVKVGPVHLKASFAVLRETVFVRRTSARQVDVVDLGHVALQGTRGAIDLAAVIRSPRAVDVESGQNFRDGLVDTQYDLPWVSQSQVDGQFLEGCEIPEHAESDIDCLRSRVSSDFV